MAKKEVAVETTPVLTEANRDVIAERVKTALNLDSNAAAQRTVKAVIEAITGTLSDNIGTNKFELKIAGLGKFVVRHTEAKERRSPRDGQMKMAQAKRKVKFTALGDLRKLETTA